MTAAPDADNCMPRRQRMIRIMDLWTRGCTSKSQIAAAVGVTPIVVSRDLKCLMRGWIRESSLEMREKLELRTQQLMAIAYEARHSFDVSKMPQRQVHRVEKDCDYCLGIGSVDYDDGIEITCPGCGGGGKTVTETVKVTESCGDAQFLKVAEHCVVEAAKLEGLYQRGEDDPARSSTYLRTITNIHNSINITDGGSNPFANAPVELLIKAKAAMALLTESARDEDVIDAEVVESRVVGGG